MRSVHKHQKMTLTKILLDFLLEFFQKVFFRIKIKIISKL